MSRHRDWSIAVGVAAGSLVIVLGVLAYLHWR